MRYLPIPMIYLTVSLVCPSAVAAQNIVYSRRALRAAMKSAHTADDYATLARYFQRRSVAYEQRSAEQAQILKQELEHPHASRKYPAPDVSARRFHEYYADQARQTRESSKKYETLEYQALELPYSVKNSN